jgi:AcrR family transcriptional regulator
MVSLNGYPCYGSIHTVSRSVKREGLSPAEARAAQGAATRAMLIEVGCELFGTKGFQETALDEIVARANVTKGALYHHFQGKEDLFGAVYEQVQKEVSDKVVAEFLRPDPWEALQVGCELWVDAHLDPAIQRIAMRDARAVLGWEAVREMEARYGAVPLRGVLRRVMRQGLIESYPLRPLGLIMMGALTEACFYVADADDREAARAEVRALVLRLLSGLTVHHDLDASNEAEKARGGKSGRRRSQ